MNMRERCERAEAYRKNGANCAQALLAAFADVMGITETQALAVGAGLGGGVRSGNICGAVNAPVMILGCAFPEMLAEKELQPTDTAMALAAGDHCGLLILSAAEILCGMIGEK